MKIPKVTVLMAVFNGECFLREAIDSILNQTFRDFEFLIVDDGSKDTSREILSSYQDPRIRVVYNEENIGLTKSLNKGLALAQSEYIARQDADDLSFPQRLEKQVCFLDTHPEVVLVGTQAKVIDKKGRLCLSSGDYRAQTTLGIRWQFLFGNPFIHTSVIFRKNIIWGEFHGYDQHRWYNQDFELWSRVTISGHKVSNLREALVSYRSHSTSIVGDRRTEIIETMKQNLIKNKQIQRNNVLQILGSERLADEWPEIWTSITVSWLTGPNPKIYGVLDILEEMTVLFQKKYSLTLRDTEMALILSNKFMYIADFFTRINLKFSLKAYKEALQWNAMVGLKESPRLMAKILLGQVGRIQNQER